MGINFDKMTPRSIIAQMANARSLGHNVIKPALDRAKFTQLSRNAGSLDSLRSAIRAWHLFATSMLDYKEHLSAPPRSSEHVLIWVTCFGQYGTALNYFQYPKNLCEIEELSTDWYDNSIISWKKGAAKFKIANGFKYTGKRIPFTWEWITALVKAFDQQRQARVSLFLLVCWAFLLRSFQRRSR